MQAFTLLMPFPLPTLFLSPTDSSACLRLCHCHLRSICSILSCFSIAWLAARKYYICDGRNRYVKDFQYRTMHYVLTYAQILLPFTPLNKGSLQLAPIIHYREITRSFYFCTGQKHCKTEPGNKPTVGHLLTEDSGR